MAKFTAHELNLIQPRFDSTLMDLIIDLNHLRKKTLKESTPPEIFFQLKNLFQLLESLESARIEGNNTTLEEYIESKIEGNKNLSSDIKEIDNIESTMEFVEQIAKDHSIGKLFISEMHKKIVEDLPFPPEGEGDRNPGMYRQINISIQKSSHKPPDFMLVPEYMDELIQFIEKEDSPKYDLLKIAIAHHRFVWIHPFGNGNGRTVRMLTYAMLVKSGFNVSVGRILNPTAIFCGNRDNYYKNLSIADSGDEDSRLIWCEYVLQGLKDEIEKIDKILNYDYLKNEILLPALKDALENKYITNKEFSILVKAVVKNIIKASDLKEIFPDKAQTEISRQIRRLIEKKC